MTIIMINNKGNFEVTIQQFKKDEFNLFLITNGIV